MQLLHTVVLGDRSWDRGDRDVDLGVRAAQQGADCKLLEQLLPRTCPGHLDLYVPSRHQAGETEAAGEQFQLLLRLAPCGHLHWHDASRWLTETVNGTESLALAESTGRIDALTDALMDYGLAEIRQWADLGRRFSLAFNLSPLMLGDRELADRIQGERPYFDALQMPGADRCRQPLETIEEIAASLVAQVREVQAHEAFRMMKPHLKAGDRQRRRICSDRR